MTHNKEYGPEGKAGFISSTPTLRRAVKGVRHPAM